MLLSIRKASGAGPVLEQNSLSEKRRHYAICRLSHTYAEKINHNIDEIQYSGSSCYFNLVNLCTDKTAIINNIVIQYTLLQEKYRQRTGAFTGLLLHFYSPNPILSQCCLSPINKWLIPFLPPPKS
jgi:hypothetical protein